MSECDFSEDEALIALDKEELEKLNRTLERYIRDQADSQNLWFLVDNLVTLEDNLGKIKSSYYDGFDKQIIQSKSLLQSAYLISEDKTIKSLILDSISKIDECLKRLGIKEEPQKYQEPYEPKKSGYPKKYGFEYPYKEPSSKEEEVGQDFSRALVYQSMEAIPSRFKLDLMSEEPDPVSDKFWTSVISKIESNKQEYEQKKQELAELNKQKLELSQEQDTLARFRQKLLNKCLDRLIEEGRQ